FPHQKHLVGFLSSAFFFRAFVVPCLRYTAKECRRPAFGHDPEPLGCPSEKQQPASGTILPVNYRSVKDFVPEPKSPSVRNDTLNPKVWVTSLVSRSRSSAKVIR